MKKLLLACAALLAMSAIVSVKLFLDLRKERQENASLQTQLADAKAARLPTLQTSIAAAATAATATAAPATASTAPGPAPELPQVRAASALSATLSALTSTLGGSSEQDLMKDPEYRKARLTQTRIQIARSYPGLVDELGLSDREASQLFDLLAENQLKTTISITSSSGNQDIAEMLKRQTTVQKEQEDTIRAMLGSGRYEQWQGYQQTRPARNQAVNLGSQLAAAGQPLSDSQTRALTSAMITEQQRQRQQPALSLPPADPANPQLRTAQLMEDSLKRTDENNRRVLEAVSPHLNAKQVATLKDQFEQQSATRRDALSRLQADPGSQTAPRIIITAPTPQ